MMPDEDRLRPNSGRVMRVAALVLAAALAGCVTKTGSISADPNPDEVFPQGLIDLAEPFAEPVGIAVEKMEFRSGYLYGNKAFLHHIVRHFEPLDVAAISNEGTLAGRLIPGYLTHSVAYVGNETQLRALGVWNNKYIRPHHAEIRAGKVIIESTNEGVHLSTPEKALDTDRVVVARPGGFHGLPLANKQADIVELFRLIGTDFDFHFDSAEDKTLFCIELIQKAVPEMNLERKVIYGRQTIKPTAVARGVFTSSANLAFVGYYKGESGGKWQKYTRAQLQRDLARSDAEAARTARYLSPVNPS